MNIKIEYKNINENTGIIKMKENIEIIGRIIWYKEVLKGYRNHWDIQWFHIEPKFRNQGYGSFLFDYFLENIVCGRGIVSLAPVAISNDEETNLDQIQLEHFYERRGFRKYKSRKNRKFMKPWHSFSGKMIKNI